MAEFQSKIDITSDGTYAMDITNGERSSKVASDLNGKMQNIQNYLQNGLPELNTEDSLPTTLSTGKIIIYENTLYFGDNNQTPTKISGGMSAEIIVTPIITFTSVKATSQTGEIYEGIYDASLQKWIIAVTEFNAYTITGTDENMTEHETTIDVDTCKQYEIELGKPAISTTLNDNTWEKIREVSDAGTGNSYWSVGDAKQITINGNIGLQNYSNYQPWVYILGFNHNSEREGNNKIHFGCFRSEQNYSTTNSIALDDSKYNNTVSSLGYFSMNTTNTNSGGWKDSYMRQTLLDADASSPTSANSTSFLGVLPSDLKAVLKQCTKYTDNTGGGQDNAGYVTSTQDWVFLLSEFEVQGSKTYANSAEQNYQLQYDYYKNGNSKIKYRQSSTGLSAYWWCRSPFSSDSYLFCGVSAGGSAGSSIANGSYGVACGFCV